MAKKLVKTGYGGGASNFPIKLYVTYSYTQSIEKNQSYVTCGMRVTTPGSDYYIGTWTDHYGSYVGTTSLTFDGTIPYFSGERTIAAGKKFTVNHDASGKATAKIYWKWGVNSTWGGYGNGTNEGSFTITLPDIARKATLLTAPNFSDSQNPTITYSNPAGSAVTTLEAGIYDSTGMVPYVPYKSDISKTGSSYTFQLTDSEKQTLLNAVGSGTSTKVRFYLRTTIGGNTYLSSPLERTFTINDANPIVTGSVVDTNATTIALTGDENKLIKYFSNAQAAMTAVAQKGAAIDESLYIIRNGDNSGYNSSYTFNNVENNLFEFIAEDSRGNIGTDAVTKEMVDYVKLTCNISNNRPDGDGDMTVSCSGTYFNQSFGAVSNTLTVQYRYAVSGGSYSSWTNMTVTANGNYYYATAYLSGLDYQKTYTFETRATDKLMTANSTGSPVTSIPVFHWSKNDFVFEVPVTFNAGTNGSDQTGSWYPTLSSSAVSSYTTQRGWYQKMGQIVTVGFFVKATCRSGYDSTTISISGLPFTPLYSAAGGGMCAGAYVSGGYTFQCFVAEASGSITTRVQACNNTSATNLSTSASGCCYRSAGGEITMSGTITFIANS